MIDIIETIRHCPPSAVYAITATAVLAESILLIGAFSPTFTLLATAGALAAANTVSLTAVVLVAATSAFLGDLMANQTGAVLGPRLRSSWLSRRIPEKSWDRAVTVIQQRGNTAIFAARFVPVVRTVVPHCTGIAGISARRIAPLSAASTLIWSMTETGLGYLFASTAF